MNTIGGVPVFWFLVAATPLFATILAAVLFRWRKHPRLADVLNFKRPFWIVLFISLGLEVFGWVVGLLIAPLLNDPHGFICIPSVLLIIGGTFVGFVCSIRFLWCLIASIIRHD